MRSSELARLEGLFATLGFVKRRGTYVLRFPETIWMIGEQKSAFGDTTYFNVGVIEVKTKSIDKIPASVVNVENFDIFFRLSNVPDTEHTNGNIRDADDLPGRIVRLRRFAEMNSTLSSVLSTMRSGEMKYFAIKKALREMTTAS
jgi:hypothetical protein